MKLKLASNLSLPVEFVTERVAFLARTGAGKSGGMRVMAEAMLDAGQFVIFLDPKGDAWGLRGSGSGKGYPVLIMGGEHRDVPLEPTAGVFVADFLVKDRVSTILDVSEFSEADMVRFVGDFADRFYRTNREAVHWFVDEADEFAPQSGYNAAALKCLGAIQRIQRRGRGRGIGVTLATQRSAVINKSVLTQAGTLIAMQTTAPHDLKAVKEWLDVCGTAAATKEILHALPTLKPREAFVYSPQLIGTEPTRIKFGEFKTFDSMRTPKPGEVRQQPKRLADIDLSAVQHDMAATIERAKADDPAELRKQIAALKRDVKQPAAVDPAAIERAVASAVKERDRHWQGEIANVQRADSDKAKRLAKIEQLARLNGAAVVTVELPKPGLTLPPKSKISPPQAKVAVKQARYPGLISSSEITARQQRFLDVAATLTTLGAEVTRESVCGWIGVHPRGGSVSEGLNALAAAGLIENLRGAITVTASGVAAAGYVDPAAAIERAKSGLTARQSKFFELIVVAHPESISRESIAETFSLHPRGGSLGRDLARLVGRGLVEGNRGQYRARDFLFVK